MTDAEIVRRVLAGEADLFGLLVDRYYDRYARFAIHMVGDREDAEDALQEAFLRAYRGLPAYEERERFGAWLLRIVVNQCRSAAAARRRRRGLQDLVAGMPSAAQPDMADRIDARHDVQRALAQLPEAQREAIVLRYADDLSYEEMSAVTGTAISALKMRVKRGCDHLRELLTGVHRGT